MNIAELIDKKVKAQADIEQHVKFPGSGIIKTLPKGKVSGLINSYLPSGYFEINQPGKNAPNLYIKDTPNVVVVGTLEEDDFNPIGTLTGFIKDVAIRFSNTKKRIEKNTSVGVDQAFSDITKFGSLLGKELKTIALVVVGLLIVLITIKLIKI